MLKRILRNNFLLISLLIISGCATQIRPNIGLINTKKNIVERSFFSGRFSVRYFNEVNEVRNVYGNFDFTNIANNINVILRSPLGIALATVAIDEKNASLKLSGKPVMLADDVNWLMIKALGFALPVEGLKYWLHGIASPKSNAVNQIYNHIGQLIKMEQDNWLIIFDYKDTRLSKIELNWITHDELEKPLVIKLILNRAIHYKNSS